MKDHGGPMSLDHLRRIASEATPGPWFANVNDLVGGWWVNDYNVNAASAGPHVVGVADDAAPDDAAHIATFDPVLVAAMLDVIDAADKLVNGDPDPVAVDGAWDALAMRLDRFREVAS